jgi:hypothetical protein
MDVHPLNWTAVNWSNIANYTRKIAIYTRWIGIYTR